MPPLSKFSDRYLDVPRLCCEVGVPLGDQPGLGHNRWHPDIPPAIEIGPGEEVILESPAYDDYQIHDTSDMEELRTVELTRMHPLAGPVRVDGAKPGDLLEVEILGVEPLSGIAFSNILPGACSASCSPTVTAPRGTRAALSRSHRTCRASGSPRSRTRARSASRPHTS